MKRSDKLKIFSYEITKKEYWLGVLVLFIIISFIRVATLPVETTEFEIGEIIGTTFGYFLVFFGALYLALVYRKNKNENSS